VRAVRENAGEEKSGSDKREVSAKEVEVEVEVVVSWLLLLSANSEMLLESFSAIMTIHHTSLYNTDPNDS